MTDTTKRVRERAKRAWATKQLFDPLWQDAYDYILPYRGGGKFRREGKGASRGTRWTTDEVTLGGGTKADGATSNRMRACVRQPASTASRP